MDVFALTIYGILLFPKVENFMDYDVINAFATFKTDLKTPSLQSWQMYT